MRTSPLVAALETCWSRLRADVPEIPDVVFVLASGTDGLPPGNLKRGHWAPMRWRVGGELRHEVFIAGEGCRDGADRVLATTLHEAAHALAFVRGIEEVSRRGAYHNRRFKALAEELGLVCSQDPRLGWSPTLLSADGRNRWAKEVQLLEEAVSPGYRRREDERIMVALGLLPADPSERPALPAPVYPTPALGPAAVPALPGPPAPVPVPCGWPPQAVEDPLEVKARRRLNERRRPPREAARCSCSPPRIFYMARGSFELDLILCGLCGQFFAMQEEEPED